MIIRGWEGSLKTANGYETISLDAIQYDFGKLPYPPKVPQIRGIIYCTDGLFGRKTYMIFHKMLYASGYAETLIGCDMRHLATSELERIGRYFWFAYAETSRKQRLSV